VDDTAPPLPSAAPADAAASDESWLLNPPSMPRFFDERNSPELSPSFAREASRTSEPAQDAWWSRATPRLQAPSGSPPSTTHQTNPQRQTAVSSPRPTAPVALVPDDAPVPQPPPPALHAASAPIVSTRTHRIADGDTLTRLAERYLHDAGRAHEIFELNREVLRDPNLLPIGTSLRIPGNFQEQAREPELGESTSASRMVPVSFAPTVGQTQPHAQLQPPAPIAHSGK
jgi:hypothetical protein